MAQVRAAVQLDEATSAAVRAQYVVWGTNVIVPLIVAPYVSRILGPAGIGLYAFCQAFAVYPALLIDWGFQMGGVRSAAMFRGSPQAQTSHVWSSIHTKLLATAAVVPVGVLTAVAFPELRSPGILALTILLAVSSGLSFEWHYRGVQNMRLVAWWNLAGRALTVPLVFILVTDSAHVERFLAVSVLGNLVTTTALWIAVTKEHKRATFCWSQVLRLFKENATFVLVQVIQAVGATLGVMLAMERLGKTEAGLWAAAQRIQGPFWALLAPFVTAVFPAMVLRRAASREAGRTLAWRLTGVVVAGGVMSGVLLALCASPLVVLLAGPEFVPAIPTVRLLSWYVPLLALTSSLSGNYMMVERLDRWIVPVSALSTAVGVALLLVALPLWGHSGAAVALIGGEAAKALVTMCVVVFSARRARAIEV